MKELAKRAAISIAAAVILWFITERITEPLSKGWVYLIAFIYLMTIGALFLWTLNAIPKKRGENK